MPTLAIDQLAPELSVQAAALPSTWRAVTLRRNWDRFRDGSSQLTVSADYSGADLNAARDAVATALRARGLRELALDAERNRYAFEAEDGKCMRVWVARDEQLRPVLRIDVLIPSDDAAGRALLADEHRDRSGTLTSVRRIWEIDNVTIVVTNDAVFA